MGKAGHFKISTIGPKKQAKIGVNTFISHYKQPFILLLVFSVTPFKIDQNKK